MPVPRVHGSGLVGLPLTADGPVQWCRDGLAIPGATGQIYTPDEADAGCHLSARSAVPEASVRSLSESPLESLPIRIRHTPPRVRPLILDDVFDWASGEQKVHVGQAFDGQGLRFSLVAGRGRIDARTGVLQVPTDRVHPGDSLIVLAENTGGQASLEIRVAVEHPSDVAATRMADTLTVDGVTFFFAAPCEIGHFITGGGGMGDPFVIGPVILRGYTPAPVTDGPARNGAMLNPDCGSESGFDDRAIRDQYRPELNAGLRLPLELVPGDSLIVGRSASEEEARTQRRTMAGFVVLTVLATVPPEDAFRPPYVAGDKPMYRLRDLRVDRLGALAPIGRHRDFAALADRFSRFALDLAPGWLRDHFEAFGHPPLYGRDLCADEASPYVVVNTAVPLEDKLPILAGLVQRGIDRGGVLRNALARDVRPWGPGGAHHSGRKFSIMFAGHLLDVDWMRNVAAHVPHAFQEDAMTFYVDEEAVAITNGPDWAPAYGDTRPQQPYEPAMIGIPDWRGNGDMTAISASWSGHPYRIAGNHNTQHGQVLALLAMGLREAWGHEAYVDYHIRYMEVAAGAPDPWRFRGGDRALFNPVEGTQDGAFPEWQQFWQDEWAYQMLRRYRFEYYSFPWA